MGDKISDSREMEYVTAGILRRRTVDSTTGSIRVLCVHTKRTPEVEERRLGGGGGLPLTTTLPPKSGAMWRVAHMGSIKPTAMRMAASMIPRGTHRMIRSAVDGVGRLARRPS